MQDLTPPPARQPAAEVWVLAGSIGALTAAVRLLGRLPPAASQAFIVALRVDPDAVPLITGLLGRSTPFRVHSAGPERIPYPGDVMVIAVNGDDDHADGQTDGASRVGMRPRSLDEVLGMIAAHYRQRAGVIALSGIGTDGLTGCKAMNHHGGRVWVQAPESCQHDSFPRAVQAACVVDRCATPEQLAESLVASAQAVTSAAG